MALLGAQWLALFTVCALGFWALIIRLRPGLCLIPGPFLASFSDAHRIWTCAKGLQMNCHIAMHKKYGPLVRVGPRHVSFADPALIPLVYGIGAKFEKSDFYKMFDVKTPTGAVPTVFSVRGEREHREIKRPIANAFSMTSLKELEPMNDECSAIFMAKMEHYAGTDIDLGEWLHWYAFDVITSITFSNRMGFMARETDIENIIQSIQGRLIYNAVVGQASYFHPYLFGNTLFSRIANIIPAVAILNSARHIVAFAAENLARYEAKDFNTANVQDLLDRFKRYKDGEQVMNDAQLLGHASGNIFAGSDTTAASFRSVFYNLCRAPHAYRTLQNEIHTAHRNNQLSDPITFAEAQALPYLQAVIKEALRVHPAVGQLLERLVPAGGAEIGGVWLPEGTVVGMNPWVASLDEGVYGDDAGVFRPERWLEAEEEELRVMERSFLAFGAGSRSCLGKNISLLEMSKLVPQVLRRFDIELSDPSKEWELHDYWFVKQTGLICKLKRR